MILSTRVANILRYSLPDTGHGSGLGQLGTKLKAPVVRSVVVYWKWAKIWAKDYDHSLQLRFDFNADNFVS